MEAWLLAQKATIASIEAEILGMITANQERLIRGEPLVYAGKDFEEKAAELRSISDMIMKER